MLDEGVERVKVVASSKPHVTFERGAEVGDTPGSKCPAKCGKRRVARGQEAIFLQPSDHLGSPARLHPSTLSNVTSGAHLPTYSQHLGFQWGGRAAIGFSI